MAASSDASLLFFIVLCVRNKHSERNKYMYSTLYIPLTCTLLKKSGNTSTSGKNVCVYKVIEWNTYSHTVFILLKQNILSVVKPIDIVQSILFLRQMLKHLKYCIVVSKDS